MVLVRERLEPYAFAFENDRTGMDHAGTAKAPSNRAEGAGYREER